VAEVMMLKKLATGIPVDEVQIRVSAETVPVVQKMITVVELVYTGV
jgi:hypothetical protein